MRDEHLGIFTGLTRYVQMCSLFGLRMSQLPPLRPDTTACGVGPFSTDGARTPAPQTNAKYVGRLLARCAAPTPMRWRNTRMADRSARIADWRALRVGSPDGTLHSTTKQRPLRFSRDTYHPLGVSTITSEKLHRVALRRRLTATVPHRKVPASDDRELRRRHSKAKKWIAHESFQAAFEQWSHFAGHLPVKSGMRDAPPAGRCHSPHRVSRFRSRARMR
jgi:hypothetical protein